MSNLRVYEAARKLNMSAGDLVKLLEEKGVQASPISTIEQDMFDRLLEEIVGGAGKSRESEPSAPLKLVSFKEKTEKKADQELKPEGTALESAKPALSLAPLPSEAAAQKETSKEEEKKESAPASVGAFSEGRGGAMTGALTYAALALAILLAVGMAFMARSLNAQSAQMESLMVSMSAAHTRIDHTNKAVSLQEGRLAQEEAALANLAEKHKLQARDMVRADVSASAEALQEMSSTMPPAQGERIFNLSKRLAELSSAI